MAQVKTGRKDASRQITPEKARSGECLSMHASSFSLIHARVGTSGNVVPVLRFPFGPHVLIEPHTLNRRAPWPIHGHALQLPARVVP
jgi:hypothetical protein